jgi:hypothetical protein
MRGITIYFKINTCILTETFLEKKKQMIIVIHRHLYFTIKKQQIKSSPFFHFIVCNNHDILGPMNLKFEKKTYNP